MQAMQLDAKQEVLKYRLRVDALVAEKSAPKGCHIESMEYKHVPTRSVVIIETLGSTTNMAY